MLGLHNICKHHKTNFSAAWNRYFSDFLISRARPKIVVRNQYYPSGTFLVHLLENFSRCIVHLERQLISSLGGSQTVPIFPRILRRWDYRNILWNCYSFTEFFDCIHLTMLNSMHFIKFRWPFSLICLPNQSAINSILHFNSISFC